MKYIGYVPGGYPTIEESLETAETFLQGGADGLEISIPPIDPSAEGPFIAERMRKAYELCSDYDVYMSALREFREKHPDIEFILLIFAETIENIGRDRYIDFHKELRVKDLVSPGIWYHPELVEYLESRGVYFQRSVHYNYNELELERARGAKGVIYMQGYPNPDQVFADENVKDPASLIKVLRENGVTADIYCGVGIHTPDHVNALVEGGAQGFYVGSGVLKGDVTGEELLHRVKAFADRRDELCK